MEFKNKFYYAQGGATQKKVAEVWRGLAALAEGKFTEVEVKLLMIDLREIARNEIKKLKSKLINSGSEFEAGFNALSEFVDVADFIAHADRDPARCNMAKTISRRGALLYEALSKKDEEEWSAASLIDGHYNGANVVLGMFLAADCLFHETIDFQAGFTKIEKALNHQHDIALCMISLLQGMSTKIQNSSERGFLYIESYGGKYRLYCRIKVQTPPDLTGCATSFFVSFPVVDTLAKDVDDVVMQTAEHVESEFSTITAEQHPIIETYRGSDGQLHVREIKGLA